MKDCCNDVLQYSVGEIIQMHLVSEKDIPEGYLHCNGQTFDVNMFPKLATVYTDCKLPDLRSPDWKNLLCHEDQVVIRLLSGAIVVPNNITDHKKFVFVVKGE